MEVMWSIMDIAAAKAEVTTWTGLHPPPPPPPPTQPVTCQHII